MYVRAVCVCVYADKHSWLYHVHIQVHMYICTMYRNIVLVLCMRTCSAHRLLQYTVTHILYMCTMYIVRTSYEVPGTRYIVHSTSTRCTKEHKNELSYYFRQFGIIRLHTVIALRTWRTPSRRFSQAFDRTCGSSFFQRMHVCLQSIMEWILSTHM